MNSYKKKLESSKHTATLHLLFKCARLLNDKAIETLRTPSGPRPTPAHMALFPHIDLEGGTRITDLALKLGISKQAVGQLVDDLDGMNVLRRVPDPEDGRAKRVVFTELGRSSMLDGLQHLKQLERELVRTVGRQTMVDLRESLLTLLEHVESDE